MRTTLFARVAVAGLAAFAALSAVPSPATAVPGLVRIPATSVSDSSASKEVLAQCPAGTRVLGGGGTINGGGNSVHFIRLQPFGNTNQFAVGAMEEGFYNGNWSVTAYAICGAQPAGLAYVGFSVAGPDAHKDATADCPAGTVALSYGARVLGSTGHVFIDAFGPKPGLTGAKGSASEDPHGDADWTFWVFAVCANTVPGWQVVWADAIPADSTPDIVTISCPTGKRVHGLGSTINPGLGEVFHNALTPNAALTAVAVSAIEDSTGAAHNWWTRAYAVCAN